jgi:hypothetical protein
MIPRAPIFAFAVNCVPAIVTVPAPDRCSDRADVPHGALVIFARNARASEANVYCNSFHLTIDCVFHPAGVPDCRAVLGDVPP